MKKEKIAIITQPLQNNYGGLLQNFAMQKVILDLGYEPITIDYMKVVCPPFWRYILSSLKTIFLRLRRKKRRLFWFSHKGRRNKQNELFVATHLKKTKTLYKYSFQILRNYGIDVVLVGSDQVWRPKYSYKLIDMFLDFCKDESNLKRIAYAASFGVDKWEYSPKEEKRCSTLAKKFNAISVRENSGVKLCHDYLGVDASWVLDPTFLLDKTVYCNLCKDIPASCEKILVAYVLDRNDSIRSMCETIASERGCVLKYFEADRNAVLSIPEWLAMFRDASYVVTDSFHGTIFSIIFEKEFKCIYNESRGSARFESLLKMYKSGSLAEMKDFSLNWLKKALES